MVAKARLPAARGGYPHAMTPDEELMVIFGALHLVALALGIVLFVMFLRSEAGSGQRPPEDDDGGGGGNDRLGGGPKTSPSGGIPLPDAEQSRYRLRTHERLRDLRPRRERRRVAEPARPGRRRVLT
jgi:hypothetical protein